MDQYSLNYYLKKEIFIKKLSNLIKFKYIDIDINLLIIINN